MSLMSRVSGSLVGGVVGDCIGAMFEWQEPPVSLTDLVQLLHALEQDYIGAGGKCQSGAGKVKPVRFTDDTAMARSIVRSVLVRQSVDAKDIARRFAEEYRRDPHRGYGNNVVTVLKALLDPSISDVFQPARMQFQGTGSYGNGGAMRVAPLALYCRHFSVQMLKEHTTAVTLLTHCHPDAVAGALLQSLAVHQALLTDVYTPVDPLYFLQQLVDKFEPIEVDIYTQHQLDHMTDGEGSAGSSVGVCFPYSKKLITVRELLSGEASVPDIIRELGTGIAALDSVPTALFCFLRGVMGKIESIKERSALERTVLYAISLGGDTDTIASMAAAISGALYGIDGVPSSWRRMCEGVEDAIRQAEQLTSLVECLHPH